MSEPIFVNIRKKYAREYAIWSGMKTRCTNKGRKDYKNYGGRGIKVCERWFNSFENFLEDMGPRPSNKHQIDRKDNNGNYEPGNCQWTRSKKQNRNRRDNVLLTYKGETKCMSEWSERFGIHNGLVWIRLEMGWSVEKALETPANDYVETFTYNGVTKSIGNWSKEFGLPYWLVRQRISRDGWTVEQALSTPRKSNRSGNSINKKGNVRS